MATESAPVIIGCYSLHLYCDTEGCPNALASPTSSGGSRPPGEFTHDKNERGAMAKARRYGWKLDLENWTCFCPTCAKSPLAED